MAADGQSFRVICDPKSLLYIYGMQLDFSTALIGGGFNDAGEIRENLFGRGASLITGHGLLKQAVLGSLHH